MNEADLIGTLGIGRSSVSEDFQQLALDNMVVILPRRGIMVTNLSLMVFAENL